ncbi:MAG: ankyrin repeat domain-containing protein [Acidobacteriota bacterium]
MPHHAVTPEGFRRMDEDFIFVAGSTDIQDYRRLAHESVNRTLSQRGRAGEIHVFSWEVEIGPEGLDQRFTMQKNLPRPADPHCRGVVAFIGERIGLPLEDSFELRLIPGIEKWVNPDHGYRLLHPWPEDLEERLDKLRAGYYPLTGTVFEVLDAFGTEASEHPTAVYLGLIADEPISLDHDISLGGDQYLREKTTGMNRTQRRAWEDTVYEQHRLAVHNFFRALNKAGRAQNPSQAFGDIDRAVSAFVAEKILGAPIGQRNPYRFLRFYDINDGLDFVGRKRTVERAVGELERRFERRRSREEDAPPLTLRLTGPSGSGKSSTLRAGVLRALGADENYDRYRVVAARPEDFRDVAGDLMPIIPTLLHLVEDETDLRLGRRVISQIQRAGANAAEPAVKTLEQHLADIDGADTLLPGRLVFGIDQFEEILDLVAARTAAEDWRPLIHFIETASRSDRLAVIYTLEDSRKDAHQKHLGEAFINSYALNVDDLSDDFLHEVIVRPFQRAGFQLSEEVVSTLKANLNALRPDDEASARNSILPLLALKLSHLFETIATIYEPRIEGGGLEFADSTRGAPRFGIPPGTLNLGFEKLIEHQATIAWRRGRSQAPIDLSELDHFLQPFVGVSDGKLQLRTLGRLRPYSAERELVDAFLQARLMVPVGREGARLVHEAVLRYWPDALRWSEKRRTYLELKARTIVNAQAWNLSGRPDLSHVANPQSLDEVAQILSSYLRAWSLGAPLLEDPEVLLRDYCLTLFQHSTTPEALIEGVAEDGVAEDQGTHVNLAASYGLLDLLERFRQIDPECLLRPNRVGKSLTRPLDQAAWAQEETVEYLLKNGASAIKRDRGGEGWPPIVAAINQGRLGIFHRLLEASNQETAGEELQTLLACPDGRSLLHLCAQYDRVGMARTLVEAHRFDPQAEDNRKWQPIHSAAAADARDAWVYFKTLQSATAVTSFQSTDLHLAAMYGSKAVVDEILGRLFGSPEVVGATDNMGATALHNAAQFHHPSCVRALLPWLCPNTTQDQGLASLHLAIPRQSNDEDVSSYEDDVLATVDALLEDPRTNVNLEDRIGRTALGAATKFPKVQKRLLDHPDLDLAKAVRKDGEPAYVLAARLGHWRTFNRYLEQHGPPQEEDLDGRGNSFLHLLAHKRSPLALVTEHAQDAAVLNARNQAGETPFDLAVAQKNWPVVEYFSGLDGLDVSPADDETTGLLLRLLEADPPPLLLRHVVNRRPELLTQRNQFGWTVWHHASAHQLANRLNQLGKLGHGEVRSFPVEDEWGRRPSDYLKSTGGGSRWPETRTWDDGLTWSPIEDSRTELLTNLSSKAMPELKGLENTDSLTLDASPLPFYREPIRLVRVRGEDLGPDPLALYALDVPEGHLRLKGQSPPIHRANALKLGGEPALAVSAANALDYLRFFCFFVRGEQGPFLVLETPDQGGVPGDLAASDREAMERLAHPAWLCAERDEGFFAAALIYYGKRLFGADFRIERTGMITMLDDVALHNDLGQAPVAPISTD